MYSFKNQEMDSFFSGLPAYVQENIIQSGVKIQSLDELKRVSDNFTQI